MWNSIYYVLLGFLRFESPDNILGELKATFWPMLTVRNVPSLFSIIIFSNCHTGSFNLTWALHVGAHDTSNWEWILMFHVLEVPKFVDHRKWCCDLFICIFFFFFVYWNFVHVSQCIIGITRQRSWIQWFTILFEFFFSCLARKQFERLFAVQNWTVESFSTLFFSSELIIKFENMCWGCTLHFRFLISDLISASSKGKKKLYNTIS